MPFDQKMREEVDGYARADLPGDLAFHVDFFSFLSSDSGLQRRVGEEFFAARYLYKVFEGLRLEDDWARRAQIQLQVQQYASIYEACIHHILFVVCGSKAEVKELLQVKTLKKWSVAPDLQEKIAQATKDANGEGVAAFHSSIPVSPEKVRFEHKVAVAIKLGVIDSELGDELKTFYAARNMIHIHAELKKGADWGWEMDFAKHAYWRLEKFRSQVLTWQRSP